MVGINMFLPPSNLREDLHSTGKNSGRWSDLVKYFFCSQVTQSRKLKKFEYIGVIMTRK
jgi:hypothetical protein